MIRELRIKNLALIEELVLDFNKGFSVFTGETGAGKSILIGAIGLLLGERASAELIRNGFEEAEVSGVFDVSELRKPLADYLEELNIEPDEGQLIIRRKITRNDRNRIHINQVPVPLGSLKIIGDHLIDFHGQHEHQSLLTEENHLLIVDNLPGIREIRQDYFKVYQVWTDADSALRKHEEKTRTLNEKRDILEFQFKELKSLDLHIGEEAELEAELALLSSSAERSTCAAEILEQLGESDDSIQKKVTIIKRKLENLEKFDASVDQWTTDIENARSLFSELETFCSSYLGKAQDSADPARIEKINSRLAKIQRLKKKYACNVEQLLNKLSSLQSDLLSIENVESDHIELQKRVSETLQACIEFGQKLRTAREHATKDFDLKISALMETLGFNGGLWKTSFEALDKPSPVGLDSCIFLVRTNSGESLLPLAKTASGGEISRLMLAIKTVLAEHDNIPVLIFDEIDTGIGGVLAGEVGKAMYNLSRSHQILCISHLHQIACMADHHFQVHKEVISDRTITKVNHLNYDQKVFEIARMLGGNDTISLEHARKLLKNTRV